MAAKPAIRLALLLCDTPTPPVREKHGDYHKIFDTWLRKTSPVDPDFTLDAFDVVGKMEYPPEDIKYDGIILTGSGKRQELSIALTTGPTSYHSRFCTPRR